MCHAPESVVCACTYVFFIPGDEGGDGVSLSVWGKSSASGYDWLIFFCTVTLNGTVMCCMETNPSTGLTYIPV